MKCLKQVHYCSIFVLILTLLTFSAKSNSEYPIDSVIRKITEEKTYIKQKEIIKDFLNKNYLSQFEQTIELAKFGITLAIKNEDFPEKGNLLRLIGVSYGRLGNIDSASTYYYAALNILEKQNNTDYLGLLYDDLARMYRKLRQPKRALDFYEKALLIYEKKKNLEGIARINNESGVVYRDEGNYTEANKRFLISLAIQEKRKDSIGIGYALEFLGYNQLMIGNTKESEKYLTKSLAIRKKISDDFGLMLSYTALGEFHKSEKNHSISNDFFLKSNEIAEKIKFVDIQKYNLEQITQNYQSLNQYKEAFENSVKASTLKDSLYDIEKIKAIEEITTKYETFEKENQLLKQRTQITENELRIKKRDQIIILICFFVFIILLTAFFVFKQQRLKSKKEKRESELQLNLQITESRNKLFEQRARISRDLHDNIGSQLSFIISAIEAGKYYSQKENHLLISKLNHITLFAKDTIQELRDTIWALHLDAISFSDLKRRTINFIEKAGHSFPSTKIELLTDPTMDNHTSFSSNDGLNMIRIIQEATNNALKHSNASLITIVFSNKTAHEWLICIKDNGVGFDENTVEKGNGLNNLRKRSEDLKAKITIQSIPNSGTDICVLLNK